ncbi:MAG: 7-cyano-7-deazaguanine reductase [Clostridia bacterium]|nr:7-cyano-7-deazaguanine reductase [Clostridia bacterium]MDN5366487.1 7-cyano-7-deazaguanine reductase [Thermacetogenium sp.]
MEQKVEDKYARRWDVDSYDTIATEVLEAIPFEYPGSKTDVVYTDPEFTSVCPWTGLPDFGTLTITYVPGDKLVELKSLKYYLNSFRNVGILQEHVVNRVKEDLVKLLNPVSLTVEAEFRPRGGISTYVRADYRRA